MKQLMYVVLGMITLGLVQSCESNRQANNYNNKALVDDGGLSFIKNGKEASLASVKASGLVIANSKNQRVIQFAKLIIDDETRFAEDFKKLETDNFVADTSTVNAMHNQMIDELATKRAAAFDKAYLDMVIEDHTRQISLFNAAIQEKNSNVADFAQKTLPVLKAHLDSAKLISAGLK